MSKILNTIVWILEFKSSKLANKRVQKTTLQDFIISGALKLVFSIEIEAIEEKTWHFASNVLERISG
jgi:hypothetical protein